MSITKYIERLRKIDTLISMMATGTPLQFAEKIGIRRSTLYQTLQELKSLGIEIKYSSSRQTYYYAGSRRLKIKLENDFTE
jgi:predicted transcriptional regulator